VIPRNSSVVVTRIPSKVGSMQPYLQQQSEDIAAAIVSCCSSNPNPLYFAPLITMTNLFLLSSFFFLFLWKGLVFRHNFNVQDRRDRE